MIRLVGLLILALAWTIPAAAQQAYWGKVAETIAAQLSKAEDQAQANQPAEAKKTITGAYFGTFETSKMEAALRKEIGAKHAFNREKQFGDLRKLIDKGARPELKAAAAELRAGLAEDARALDKAGVSPDVFAVNQ